MSIHMARVRGWMNKTLLLVRGARLLVFGLLYVFQPYIGSENSHSEFGYYGQYNRVKQVLESMPTVRIAAHWRHHDLTLEDFGFTLLREGASAVQVNVYERSLEMRTWRKSRLGELLQKQIDASQPPQENQMGLFPDSFYEKSPELKAWRQARPNPVLSKPIDPKQPMLAKRKLRPGESISRPIDANQPAREPAPGQPPTTAPPQ